MQLSDVDLVCAAQSGDKSARDQFYVHFKRLLFTFANRACRNYERDFSEAEEIVQRAIEAFFNPTIARFDLNRAGRGVQSYLLGLVQNAARQHAAFVHHQDEQRHDYADPINAKQHLPADEDAISDPTTPRAAVERRDHAAAVLVMATPEVRILLVRLFFDGESMQDVAIARGVDRSTLSRKLNRFYETVRMASRLAS